MFRFLLFITAILFASVTEAQYWIAPGNVVHPEQIIKDYQPDENDKKAWFEENIKPYEVSEVQKAYLIKKLRLENHGSAFKDAGNYSVEKTEDWKKLSCKIIRLFKNKKYGKNTLALFCLSYGDNCNYNYVPRSENLPVESDEYFVAPVSALETYRWPKGDIPKYHYKQNGIHEISIMAAKRPDHYGRKFLRTNLTYFEPKNFSDSTLKNLRTKLDDDDLYYEMLEMGQLNKTYHTYSSSYIYPMVKFDPHGRGMELLITYSMGVFTTDKGEHIEIMYAPNVENDQAMNEAKFSDYRGSTNGRDCYYFVRADGADDIGRGNTIDYALARIFRKVSDKFKGWDQPMRGYFQKLRGYCCMGYETAQGYGAALISEDRTLYFLNDGSISSRSEAETKLQSVIKDLDNVNIVKYGKLNKEPFVPEKTEGNVSYKYQPYSIVADGKNLGVQAILIKFRDDFYLVGIEVMGLE
ncbi:MAG: hypothetical protein IPP48_16720 [Chitinophagaceae bacterium]|nr:hypothetical protein [Chitinophagaceae bacterium]